jgi:hypothetical protein
VVDHGMLEEETPVTWEALVLPAEHPGYGGPVTSLRRAEPLSMQVRPVWRHVRRARRRSVDMQVGTQSREDRRGTDETWVSDDRIVAMKWGNGWHPKPAEQRRSVSREIFRREP